MKMNDEELLYVEEMEHALLTMAHLTQAGTVHWTCTDYKPLSLMPTNDVREAYVSHQLQAETVHNRQTFHIEITEILYIPSGLAELSIIFASAGMDETHYYATSHASENDHAPILRFADAIMVQLSNTQAILSKKKQGYFKPHLYPYRINKSPIISIIKQLFNKDEPLDFHHFIFSSEMRTKWMGTLKSSN